MADDLKLPKPVLHSGGCDVDTRLRCTLLHCTSTWYFWQVVMAHAASVSCQGRKATRHSGTTLFKAPAAGSCPK